LADFLRKYLGSGLIDHNQKQPVAAMEMTDMRAQRGHCDLELWKKQYFGLPSICHHLYARGH
jgi:hypothetical protein